MASIAIRGKTGALMVGALGVVFGDIGTSPLYSLQTAFSLHHSAVAPSEGDVLGVISMVTWCLIIVVTVAYIGLIMRADNAGEGGMLALTALLLRKTAGKTAAIALLFGAAGAALFFGDSIITPAISVLSAFEGIEVIATVPNALILPLVIAVLTVLFAAQRWGTATIGRGFGPIMVVWFLALAALGLPHVMANPGILRAVSPHYAVAFVVEHPTIAFVALGAVVLTITGAEALYADMGHFGRRPIALAWLAMVFPALLLNYYGQGALILDNPAAVANPFFLLAPEPLRLPLVVLAALATVVASQAVISGAFSVARQASRMSLLPRLKVTQTSPEHGGQIYIGTVNALLFVGVLLLILVFQESSALASAYGLAVTATIVLVLALFLIYSVTVLRWPVWRVVLMAVIVGGLELLLLVTNVVKIASGGWLPLVFAVCCLVIMLTWKRGSRIVFGRRRELEGPLADFLAGPASTVTRVPGLAVYPHGDPQTVPLALRAGVELNCVLHRSVVLITMVNVGVPHVAVADRLTTEDLGRGVTRVTYRVGFRDNQDVPAALAEAGFDPAEAVYFLSVFRIEPGAAPGEGVGWFPRWQRALFRQLERASANRTQVLHLPPARTVVMGTETLV